MSEFDLEALRKLGEADRRLDQARRRLERAPELAAPQRARVAKAKAELEQLALNQREAAKQIKALELQVASLEAEQHKTLVALNQAKSNAEYQALTAAMERKKTELSALETRVLEGYEAQEAREEQAKAGKERLASQEKEFASASERVAAEEATSREAVAKCEAARKELATGVAEKHLALYEELAARTGDALAEVVDEMCQGCGMKVRPEQISLIRGATQMATCGNCKRILWGRF